MAVRSKALGHVSNPAPNVFVTIYTCPADMTAIVKSVSSNNSNSVSVNDAYAVVRAGETQAYTFHRVALTTQATEHFQCWIVLEPGDQLQIFATNTNQQLMAAGAELDGVAS